MHAEYSSRHKKDPISSGLDNQQTFPDNQFYSFKTSIKMFKQKKKKKKNFSQDDKN